MTPNNTKPPKTQVIFGILIIVVLIGLSRKSCSSDTPEQKEEHPAQVITNHPPVLITAAQLNKYYQDNEVSADEQFKGRRVRVAGLVTGIKKDAFDNIYVELSTGEMFQTLQCQDVPSSVASGLSKGNKVVIEGTVKGLFMGMVFVEKCDNCQLIK